MAFLKVEELEPKMITATDIRTESGIVLVRRNTMLTLPIIEKLKKLGVNTEIEILDESIIKSSPQTEVPGEEALEKEIPEGYKTDKGYIISTKVVKKQFSYPGNIIINSDVADSKIRATGSIVIMGNVLNSQLNSIAGGIRIEKEVKSTKDDPSILIAAKNIIVNTAINCQLKAGANVEIAKLAQKCVISAGHSINAPQASVLDCELSAGEKIVVFIAGDENKSPVKLHITYDTIKKMFQRLTLIEQELTEYDKEITRLLKSLEVVKLLGDRIKALPEEKQLQLKEQHELYLKYNKAYQELTTEKKQLASSLKALKDSEDVVIHIKGFAFPGVVIQLDKVTLELKEMLENVGFYKKGLIRIKEFNAS